MEILQSRPKTAWEKVAFVLATGGGIGLIPKAPGTFGSLWGIVLAWALQAMELSTPLYLGAIVLLLAIGIPICETANRFFTSKDPGSIVYDEYSAMTLIFFAVKFNVVSAIAGFLLFRLFDIWKPWPIRRLERLPGGVGVMADDIGAALMAAAALWGVLQLTGRA
jgi:phosphatidylglycerophosphatase A